MLEPWAEYRAIGIGMWFKNCTPVGGLSAYARSERVSTELNVSQLIVYAVRAPSHEVRERQVHQSKDVQNKRAENRDW